MLERLVDLRAPISLEPRESGVDNLSAKARKLLAAAAQVLKPLDQATTELCADRCPTLPQEIPLVHCTEVVQCKHVLEGDESALFSTSHLCSLATWFSDLKIAPIPAEAMTV